MAFQELRHITGYPPIQHLVRCLISGELGEDCNPVEHEAYYQAFARETFKQNTLQAVSSALTEMTCSVSSVAETYFRDGSNAALAEPIKKFVETFYDWFDELPFGVED